MGLCLGSLTPLCSVARFCLERNTPFVHLRDSVWKATPPFAQWRGSAWKVIPPLSNVFCLESNNPPPQPTHPTTPTCSLAWSCVESNTPFAQWRGSAWKVIPCLPSDAASGFFGLISLLTMTASGTPTRCRLCSSQTITPVFSRLLSTGQVL